MADDETDVVETPETEVATPEVETEETNEANPIEALASDLGWTPKDQFRGDPEKWKPADEFIRASRDINQNLHRELRSLRDQVGRMSETSATIAEQIKQRTIAERDTYWANVQAKAVEDGDNETVNKAVDERMKLKLETANEKPVQPSLPPETSAFIERNKAWFDVDPLATMRAQEVCDQLAKRGVPVAEQLSQAERLIRKEFPEHFPAAAKQAAGVQTATARSANATPRKKGFADMPSESQKMAQDYQKRLGIPLEKFAESYWADQAQARRVG